MFRELPILEHRGAYQKLYVIEIRNIDCNHWPIGEYIEQVLLVTPKSEKLTAKFLHYPQTSELMIFNVTLDDAKRSHYFCGKTQCQNMYSVQLDQPLCIVQFKPYAWYAFGRLPVERYQGRMLKLPCSTRAEPFDPEALPDYLQHRFQREKSYEPAYRMMPEIVDYIDTHLNTVNVNQLGRTFRLSEATLRRYFKKFIGLNVSDYIRYRKVREMTLRLYRGDYNALAVQECGFYDQSHFIREFRRIHDTTPTQFIGELRRVFTEDSNAERLFNACYVKLEGEAEERKP